MWAIICGSNAALLVCIMVVEVCMISLGLASDMKACSPSLRGQGPKDIHTLTAWSPAVGRIWKSRQTLLLRGTRITAQPTLLGSPLAPPVHCCRVVLLLHMMKIVTSVQLLVMKCSIRCDAGSSAYPVHAQSQYHCQLRSARSASDIMLKLPCGSDAAMSYLCIRLCAG